MVKASTVDFHYPLVGFSQDQGALGFDDLTALTRCSPIYIRKQAHIGMELIDNGLRRWTVRSIELREPVVEKRWWQIFTGPGVAEFDLELDEAEPIGLDELKRRLLDEWELEDSDDAAAVRAAPDLATMFEKSYQQGSGLI